MNRTIRTCLAAAACLLILASCPSPLMDAVKAKVAREEGKAITSFGFTMAANPKVYRDIVGVVDESTHTIAVTVPKWIPLTNLVATFEFEGASVSVDGAAQESGVTAHDFTSPLAYTVTPVSGDPVTYTVTATTGPQGLMGGSIQGVPLDLDGTVDTVAGQASIFGDPAGCVIVPGTPEYIYITDFAYHVIWRIQNSSPYTCTVFAGALGEPGDSDALAGPATAARFTNPWGIATDNTNLFVADYGNGKVRKVDLATGTVTTLASGLYGPIGLFYWAAGSFLYEIDADDGTLQTIDMGGTVTELVRFWDLPSSTGNEYPVAVVRDGNDKLYVADQGVNTIWSAT